MQAEAAEMLAAKSSSRHDHAADGLRGLAAFNVALSHFAAAYFPALLHFHYPGTFARDPNPGAMVSILQNPFLALIYNGHFPVMVFFVLSGYVLTLPHWAGKPEKIVDRLGARYLRLFIPIVASIVLASLLYKLGAFANQSAGAIAGSDWLRTYYEPTQTDLRLADFPRFALMALSGGSAMNPPLWSLRIEFIGSVLLLACYALFKPARFDTLLLMLFSGLLYLIFKADSIYYTAIFAGAWLGGRKALQLSLRWPIGLAGLYFGAFVYGNALFDWLPDPLIFDRKNFYNGIGAILLVSAVINGLGASLLNQRWVQSLGRLSFSLYLTHFLVLCSVSCGFYLIAPANAAMMVLNFFIYLAACLVLAWLFTRAVDEPAMSASRRFAAMLRSQFLRRLSNSAASDTGVKRSGST